MEIQEDSLILLCSDGLSDGELLETHAETGLMPLLQSKTNLEKGLLDLIHLAKEKRGHDNITGVAIRLKLRPVN